MNNLEHFRKIKAFIFDVDGVLSDSNLFVFEQGKIVRQLYQKDLFAIKKAIDNGFRIAVISGGNLDTLIQTFKGLGIVDIYEKSRNKKEDFDDFKLTYQVENENILYMGDDLPDYAVMRVVGLATCPINAAPEIRDIAQYHSPYKGGEGCVRDVIEKVLKLRKVWKLESFTQEKLQ